MKWGREIWDLALGLNGGMANVPVMGFEMATFSSQAKTSNLMSHTLPN